MLKSMPWVSQPQKLVHNGCLDERAAHQYHFGGGGYADLLLYMLLTQQHGHLHTCQAVPRLKTFNKTDLLTEHISRLSSATASVPACSETTALSRSLGDATAETKAALSHFEKLARWRSRARHKLFNSRPHRGPWSRGFAGSLQKQAGQYICLRLSAVLDRNMI